MISPFIFEKTKDGEVLYDIFSRLVKDRILFLATDVSPEAATIISASMLFLDSQSDKPISLYINSPGGSIHSGLFTIFDTMNYIKSPVHTVCIGEAYSAASMLLAAGAKGHRSAFPNANIMIHEVQLIFPCDIQDKISDFSKKEKRFNKLNSNLTDILAKLTGKKVETVKHLMTEETYFSAEEAKEFGLIDNIIGSPKKTRAR